MHCICSNLRVFIYFFFISISICAFSHTCNTCKTGHFLDINLRFWEYMQWFITNCISPLINHVCFQCSIFFPNHWSTHFIQSFNVTDIYWLIYVTLSNWKLHLTTWSHGGDIEIFVIDINLMFKVISVRTTVSEHITIHTSPCHQHHTVITTMLSSIQPHHHFVLTCCHCPHTIITTTSSLLSLLHLTVLTSIITAIT